MRDPIILQIVGMQNVGKTALTIALLEFLATYQMSVAVLKHDGHVDNGRRTDWEKEQSDTNQFGQNGAKMTLVAGGRQSLLHVWDDKHATDVSALCERLIRFAEDKDQALDVILVEGFKMAHFPKILVVRHAQQVHTLLAQGLVNVRAIYVHEEKPYWLNETYKVYGKGDISALARDVGLCSS